MKEFSDSSRNVALLLCATPHCTVLHCAPPLAAEFHSAQRPPKTATSSTVTLSPTFQHLHSLIPYTYHPLVIEAAVTAKKDFVSTSYVSPVMQGYDERCVSFVRLFVLVKSTPAGCPPPL